MCAHYSMHLAVIALVLAGPALALEDAAAPAKETREASGFLAAKAPSVFAVNPAADSTGAFAGVPAESFGADQQADVASGQQSLPAGEVATGAMSAGDGAGFATAGPMATAGAMPAAPGEGGSGSASTVFTAVGVTVLLMSLCCCAVAYCCFKELCGGLFGMGADGADGAGDYDLANMGEAGLAGAAAEHLIVG